MKVSSKTFQTSDVWNSISSAANNIGKRGRSFFASFNKCFKTSKTLLQYTWRAMSPKKHLSEDQREAAYKEKSESLQKEFKSLDDTDEKVALGGKFMTHLSRKRRQQSKKVDMHAFNNVIRVDAKSKTVHVEGMTNLFDLVEETLKHGFLPKVVPELGGITVGGAISGLAVESSSFKYGLFHRAVKEMEVICGDGRILVCTPDNENSELFYAMANSYGTLGYILSAKIELVPVKPYVHLHYTKCDNLEDYFQKMKEFCANKDEYDFVDGAIFSKDSGVIVTGKFTDDTQGKKCSNYRPRDIYYKEIQKREEDYLTASDYIWRWDTDTFWESEGTIFQNKAFRILLGKYILRSNRMMVIKHIARDLKKKFITKFYGESALPKKEKMVQDIGIPIDKCSEFIEWFDKKIGIYPLFICPYEAPDKETKFSLLGENDLELTCDVGFFSSKETKFDPEKGHYNRLVEEKVCELDGFKSLYSASFFPKEEFKRIYYQGETYSKLKKKYDPNGRFLTLFQKCVKNM